MFSLFVVEDDPVTRKGITSSIDWEKHGFHVIGEASNGRDAFSLIQKVMPDIVVTDIKMPIENGLILSQNILERFPYIRIIILSGYEDFNYARQAIQIGVKEYLLKPVDADILLSLVQKLGCDIAKEKETDREASTKDEMIKDNLPQLRNRFLNRIILSITEPDSEFRRKSRMLGIHFEALHYQVMIVDLDDYIKERSKVVSIILERIEKVLYNECQVVAFCNEQGSAVAILDMDKTSTAEMKRLMDILKDDIRKVTDSPVNFFLGGISDGFRGIPHSYGEALNALKSSIYTGTGNREHKKVVAKAIAFIEENYQNKINIGDIVKSLYVSPNYFSKIFAEETGVNFIDYLNRFRVDKAKKMMADTDLKIYEVAEKVGYQNNKYFNFIFNRYAGCAPKEYRSKQQGRYGHED